MLGLRSYVVKSKKQGSGFHRRQADGGRAVIREGAGWGAAVLGVLCYLI